MSGYKGFKLHRKKEDKDGQQNARNLNVMCLCEIHFLEQRYSTRMGTKKLRSNAPVAVCHTASAGCTSLPASSRCLLELTFTLP